MDMQPSNLENIQNEYRRIDEMWLRVQYRLMIGLAFFAFSSELVLSFLLNEVDLIAIPFSTYLWKYLFFPTICNAFLVFAAAAAAYSHRLTLTQKMYAVSLALTIMAFTLYTVHSIFPSLFLIFLIPMVLTVLYGNLVLTSIVSSLSVLGKILSDLFLFWDPRRPHVFSNQESSFDFGLSLLLLLLFYVLCCCLLSMERLKNEVSLKLEREREQLWQKSMIDPLTCVGNRQAMREAFFNVEQTLDVKPFSLSLAVMDLDDFKRLNDTYGYVTGDRFLQALGKTLLSVTSDSIRPFRFGGDEFCLMFYGHSREEIQSICQQVQQSFFQKKVHPPCPPLSISIGIAQYTSTDTLSQLFDKADKALYQAKRDKGSICFYHTLGESGS